MGCPTTSFLELASKMTAVNASNEGSRLGYSSSLDADDEETGSNTIPNLSFQDDKHPVSILHSINMMRKNRTFCDVVLQVESSDIPAHRVVLASVSSHLMELFQADTDSKESIISYKLNGVFEKHAVEKLVDYAYTSRLELDPDEVKSVFVAANQLKIDRVVKVCGAHLVNNLNIENAIDIRALHGISKDKSLVAKVDAFISENFNEIVKTSGFLSLPCVQIEVLSQSEAEMKMVSGNSVCQLAFDWLSRANEENCFQDLVEKTHMLYLALDNSLQDCSELPNGDIGDTELVQDYKRLSRATAVAIGNKKKKKALAAAKPRIIMYSRNISCNSEELETENNGRIIAATELKDLMLLGLGFLSSRPVCLSVMLRLNTNSGQNEITEPELYRELASMANVKCGAGCANLNGCLLVCGGYDRGECLRSVELYSPANNEWRKLAPMLEARGRFNIAVINNKVYAVGGCNGTTELSTVEVFSSETSSWERVASLPLPRSNMGVCNVEDYLYCIGGFNGQVGIKQCDVFDPKTGKWDSIAPLKMGRYQSGCCGYDGKVWAVGGCDGWNNLTSVEVYDPKKDSWSYAQPMSTPRRGCGLALFNGKLYAVGGSDGTHSLSTTEIYDPVKKTWLPGPDMSVARSNVGVAVIGQRLYAVGGFSGKTFLNSIEFLEEGMEEWNTFCIKDKEE